MHARCEVRKYRRRNGARRGTIDGEARRIGGGDRVVASLIIDDRIALEVARCILAAAVRRPSEESVVYRHRRERCHDAARAEEQSLAVRKRVVHEQIVEGVVVRNLVVQRVPQQRDAGANRLTRRDREARCRVDRLDGLLNRNRLFFERVRAVVRRRLRHVLVRGIAAIERRPVRLRARGVLVRDAIGALRNDCAATGQIARDIEVEFVCRIDRERRADHRAEVVTERAIGCRVDRRTGKVSDGEDVRGGCRRGERRHVRGRLRDDLHTRGEVVVQLRVRQRLAVGNIDFQTVSTHEVRPRCGFAFWPEVDLFEAIQFGRHSRRRGAEVNTGAVQRRLVVAEATGYGNR